MTELPALPQDPINDDDDSDLEALLASATQAVADKQRIKALAKGAKKGLVEAAAEYRELEIKLYWTSIANVALFQQHECSCCGSVYRVFAGFYLFQIHQTDKHARRWQQTQKPQAGLRQQTAIQVIPTAICTDCAAFGGWSFTQQNQLFPTKEASCPDQLQTSSELGSSFGFQLTLPID